MNNVTPDGRFFTLRIHHSFLKAPEGYTPRVADPRIDSNDKIPNPNITVLEWLNTLPAYRGRVAAFGAWDGDRRVGSALLARDGLYAKLYRIQYSVAA